jgi:3-oxoacyl-[acyl-carrier-protein] synthase-3
LSLYIHALGHAHPATEISNAFLESLDIGTTDAWILERVGIRCRRSVLPLDYIRETRNRDPRAAAEAALETQAALTARAARMALARAGLEPEDVGMVVCGGSAPDTSAPAEACNAARELGIAVPALDIASACTSLFAQLRLLDGMRDDALPDFVLALAVDTLTRTVDYEDRSTAVLWGDGAAAAVVSTRVPGRARVVEPVLTSDPAGSDKVVVPRAGHFTQQGHAVQMFAIKKTAEGVVRLRDGVADPEREFHFVGHQANLRMLEVVCRQCEIPPERHHSNVEWYGNTGAASAASVLSMGWEKWGAADDVAVVGVGAGLTWGSFLLRFGP